MNKSQVLILNNCHFVLQLAEINSFTATVNPYSKENPSRPKISSAVPSPGWRACRCRLVAPLPLRPLLAPGGRQTGLSTGFQAWLRIRENLCVPRLKFLRMGSPGEESTWAKKTRVRGWGRDPECIKEALTQTLPGGTRPCGSGGTERRPCWEPDHTEGNTKGRCPLSSRPTWSLGEQHEVGALDCCNSCHYQHWCRTSVYILSFLHIHDFPLGHMGSEAEEFWNCPIFFKLSMEKNRHLQPGLFLFSFI